MQHDFTSYYGVWILMAYEREWCAQVFPYNILKLSQYGKLWGSFNSDVFFCSGVISYYIFQVFWKMYWNITVPSLTLFAHSCYVYVIQELGDKLTSNKNYSSCYNELDLQGFDLFLCKVHFWHLLDQSDKGNTDKSSIMDLICNNCGNLSCFC